MTKKDIRFPEELGPNRSNKAKAKGLVLIPSRNSAKYSSDHGRDTQRAQHGLQKDSILNLPQRRLLDPHLAVKDLAYEVAPLVALDPRLVLVADATTQVTGLVRLVEILG